jgi:large subunit ribosomal protein L46
MRQAAERILTQSGGVNMNTWIVGNHPVGHRLLQYKEPKQDETGGRDNLGEKLFYMKARIMAGQANLTDNKFGLKDFKWLAREELEQQVEKPYWNSIKNMLPAR